MSTIETGVAINPYMLTQENLNRLTGKATLTLPEEEVEPESNPSQEGDKNLSATSPQVLDRPAG